MAIVTGGGGTDGGDGGGGGARPSSFTSCGVNQILTQQIPQGTNQSFTTHNTNRQVGTGAISSNAGHNAGSISLRSTATFGNLTLDRTEIKGLGATPGGGRRRIIIC